MSEPPSGESGPRPAADLRPGERSASSGTSPKKVCLITGATSGLGRAAATAIARQGWRMVLVGRNPDRGAETVAEVCARSGNEDVAFLRADFASLAEIRALAADFRAGHRRLDVLVNNAGAIFQRRETSADGFERTFAVNHLAHFLLTTELLDLLRASAPARIVNVSSGAHRAGHVHFDDIDLERRYSAFRAYGQSKLANVLFTRELARRLAGTGVTANSMHPGFVASGFATNNGRFARALLALLSPFARSPEKAASTLTHLAVAPELEQVTGGYFQAMQPTRVSKEAADPEVARRLWELSERLVRPSAA